MNIKEIESKLVKIEDLEDQRSFLQKQISKTKDEAIKERLTLLLEHIEESLENKIADEENIRVSKESKEEPRKNNLDELLSRDQEPQRSEQPLEEQVSPNQDNIQRNYGVSEYRPPTQEYLNISNITNIDFEAPSGRVNNVDVYHRLADTFIREGIFDIATDSMDRERLMKRLGSYNPADSYEELLRKRERVVDAVKDLKYARRLM